MAHVGTLPLLVIPNKVFLARKGPPPLRSVHKTTERRRGLSHLSSYSKRGVRIRFASQRDGPLIVLSAPALHRERSAAFLFICHLALVGQFAFAQILSRPIVQETRIVCSEHI